MIIICKHLDLLGKVHVVLWLQPNNDDNHTHPSRFHRHNFTAQMTDIDALESKQKGKIVDCLDYRLHTFRLFRDKYLHGTYQSRWNASCGVT